MEDPDTDNAKFVEGKSAEELDSIHRALKNLWVSSGDDATDTEVLRSRIEEQSTLICILKQRADTLLGRCQTLQKMNTEQEDKITNCHKELDEERKKCEILEKRFMVLAANNQAIIVFKDEYKSQNEELRLQNQQLQSENDSLFSKKLQDKETTVQSLMQEIKLLQESTVLKETDHSKQIAGFKAKLLKQAREYETKQASLVEELQTGQQKFKNTAAMCNDLKVQLQKTKAEYSSKEANMMEAIALITKEKDNLLLLSMERGKLIQEKQQELEQMEIKLSEEKRLRTKAEERFKREAEAVNADAKVEFLQAALDEYTTKYEKQKRDFDAFKEHSNNLLVQERELNKKLQLMTG